MREVVFVSEICPHKLHTLTASLNMDADLVFDDEEYYPAMNGDDGREVDDVRLFRTLERMAQSGHWKSLDEIET